MTVSIHLMTPDHASLVSSLGDLCYLPQLHESEESIRRKVTECPDGCFVATDEMGICGYIISFPRPYPISVHPLGNHPIPTGVHDYLYVYDLAVHPAHRRQGVGQLLSDRVEQYARDLGLSRLGLAAAGTYAALWWNKRGYDYVQRTHAGSPRATTITTESGGTFPVYLMEKWL